MRQLNVLGYAVRMVIIFLWLGIFAGIIFLTTSSWWYTERSLNVLAWGDMLDAHTLAEFYRMTGIRVYVHAYATHKELLVTAQATKGKGYDVIIASDLAVTELRRRRLLKRLDSARIAPLMSRINPVLLGHHFDPRNEHTLPYNWELFVLGYDRRVFPQGLPDASWGAIFKKPSYRIAMVNDSLEAVCCAALYYLSQKGQRFGDELTAEQRMSVRNLLIAQHAWVYAYAEFRADYFLVTGACPVVISSLSPILRGMHDFAYVGFVLPREGTFVTIENIALSAASKKDDAAYTFIDYLFSREVMHHNFNSLFSLPATTDALESREIPEAINRLLTLTRDDFKQFFFFKPLMPETLLNDVWISVKSH